MGGQKERPRERERERERMRDWVKVIPVFTVLFLKLLSRSENFFKMKKFKNVKVLVIF